MPKGTDVRTGQQIGIRSASQVADDMGVCETTIWRYCQKGLLTKVNMFGRAYITLDSLDLFYARARKGEFAKEHHGACKKK